eukprot:3857405-Rhodomonas_salina.1
MDSTERFIDPPFRSLSLTPPLALSTLDTTSALSLSLSPQLALSTLDPTSALSLCHLGTTVPVQQPTQSDTAGAQGLQSTREMATPAQGDGARPHADGAHEHPLRPPALGDGEQTNADGVQSSASTTHSTASTNPGAIPRQFSRFNGNGASLVNMQSALPPCRQGQTSKPGVPSW